MDAITLHRDPRGRFHDRLPHITVGDDLGIVPVEIQRQSWRCHNQHRADIDVRDDQNVSGFERYRRSGVHYVDIRLGQRAGRDLRPNDTAGDAGTQPRRYRDGVLQQVE